MSETVIRVEHLGKKYLLAGQAGGYTNLREKITEQTKAFYRQLWHPLGKKKLSSARRQEFWALEDVCFEVKAGDRLGIIGRNGAGKSTLLKILSRITDPTRGRVVIKGRVASLLEVGTGFHPELTGRENIYLNGAILGMSKVEIKSKFDEIVAFAEVEKFLDTPVKRYSSGMYVRLAFAVAAHLEPEILIVDEVLAVGDAQFQKKCLGKMQDVSEKEGRTVLFVSHNMTAIQSLCQKAILLNAGKVVLQGSTREVRDRYLEDMQPPSQTGAISLDRRCDRSGDGSAKLVALQIQNVEVGKAICLNSRLKLTISYRSDRPIFNAQFRATIYDCNNVGIYSLNSEVKGGIPEVIPSEGSVVCITEPINLTAGRCYINLSLLKGGVMTDYIQCAASFDVEADNFHGWGKIPDRDWVICLLQHQWLLDESTSCR